MSGRAQPLVNKHGCQALAGQVEAARILLNVRVSPVGANSEKGDYVGIYSSSPLVNHLPFFFFFFFNLKALYWVWNSAPRVHVGGSEKV